LHTRLHMSPPSISKTPNTVGRAPNADLALGEVASQRDDANAKLDLLDEKLGKIDAALANPAHADKRSELLELKHRFTKERKAALTQRDGAERKLAVAFGTMGGTGPAKEAASKEYTKLSELDGELTATRKDQIAAVKNFASAANAYEAAARKYGILSPQAKAAEVKTVGAQHVLAQVDRQVGSLEHARSAVATHLDGTERKAFEEAMTAGAVFGVSEFAQLANASLQHQLQVLGAPVVTVTRDQAVDAALTRLTKAGATGKVRDDRAATMAKTFTAQLKGATPAAQSSLVKGAAGRPDLLPELAAMAQQSEGAASALADTMKAAQGPAQTELATEVARGTESMRSQLVQTLDSRMKNGDGFEEAYALERGLKAAGKPSLARQVADLSRTRMAEITADFATRGREIGKAKTDLARLIAGFGPLIPADRQQAAVDTFKARHKGEFDAWEKSGSKLAHASTFIVENSEWNEKAAALLPDALNTEGGQALVNLALLEQGRGLRTFLDHAKNTSKVAKNLQLVVVKTVTQQAATLTRAGKISEAKKALEGLTQNAGLLGMEQKSVDALVTSLQGVVAGDEKALRTFEVGLRSTKPSQGVGTALKAFAWAATIASGIQRGLNESDLKSMVKASAEIIGPTGEMAAKLVELLAKAESAFAINAKMLGKATGGIGSGFGAALDAISAVQSFARGQTVEGSIAATQAIGGAVLAVDAFGAALGMQVVPVWGQIAGAALVIGGTIGKFAWESHKANKLEAADEADAMAYLQGAGIPEPISEELKDIKRADGRNVGMLIQQLAPSMGTDATALFERVKKLSPGKLREFVDVMKDVVLDEQGAIGTEPVEYDASRRYSELRGDVNAHYGPKSLANVTAWTSNYLRDNGV
jgi:hypothetical protein